MYFPECFAMNAGISAMYFLKPPKSFTDKSSTKYAFIPYLANLHQLVGRIRSANPPYDLVCLFTFGEIEKGGLCSFPVNKRWFWYVGWVEPFAKPIDPRI